MLARLLGRPLTLNTLIRPVRIATLPLARAFTPRKAMTDPVSTLHQEVETSKRLSTLSHELMSKLSDLPNPPDIQMKARQHVNPLSTRHQQPIELPSDWVSQQYTNPGNPFVVDIGCAKGSWALQFAEVHPELNVLGIEIREPMVELAKSRAQRLNIPNVHYICTNANVNFLKIAEDIARFSTISKVAINFPDPHFKKRNFKRRLVNSAFVQSLAQALSPGAEVCFQSDVFELCEAAVKAFASGTWFTTCAYHNIDDLQGNINSTGIMTEREVSVLNRNLNVYRISYVRNGLAFTLPEEAAALSGSSMDEEEIESDEKYIMVT